MDAQNDAEGGREADLRCLLAHCKAVGLRPPYNEERARELRFTRKGLEALMRFREIAEVVWRWLSQP